MQVVEFYTVHDPTKQLGARWHPHKAHDPQNKSSIVSAAQRLVLTISTDRPRSSHSLRGAPTSPRRFLRSQKLRHGIYHRLQLVPTPRQDSDLLWSSLLRRLIRPWIVVTTGAEDGRECKASLRSRCTRDRHSFRTRILPPFEKLAFRRLPDSGFCRAGGVTVHEGLR